MSQPTINVEVSLPEYVDLMRTRKGITQVALADRLGVRRQTLTAWSEQGWQGVRIERIVQVCSELDIDPAVFLPKEAS
jgi:DNA-binding XRE family transcriptional regulator